MDKFGRNYNLFVQMADKEILRIAPPFTLEFDITRNILGSANSGSFRIYNLNKDNRNNLRFNAYNYGNYRSIKLYAGYGSNLSLIFSGNLQQAWSVREGVNFITTIEAFDAGFAFVNSPFNVTVPAQTNQVEVIKQMIQSMGKVDPSVSVGAISNSYSAPLDRANAYSGNSADLLQDSIAGGAFFIDNGKANVLGDNECLKGAVPEISAETGLLNTPHLEQNILIFDILFEPRIIVGQLIDLKSLTDKSFNGSYKVTSIQHRGMISPAVCGDAITTIGCLTGVGGALQLVQGAA